MRRGACDRGAAAASPPARPATACRAAARAAADAGAAASSGARRARPACPACGPPSSLSPLNATRSAPAAMLSCTVGSCARPKRRRSSSVPLPRSSTSSRPRARASVGELGERHRRGEADDAVVARMHLQQHARRGRDRVGVVGEAGLVGGADLDQPRAALADHVGDAEAAADLDQLAARDDHLARRPAARSGPAASAAALLLTTSAASAPVSAAQQRLDIWRSASRGAPRREVELEVGSSRARPRPRRPIASGGERRAAEIGVQHDAGRVDHAAQAHRAGFGDMRVAARATIAAAAPASRACSARMPARSSASTERSAADRPAREERATSAAASGASSRRCTCGRARSRAGAGFVHDACTSRRLRTLARERCRVGGVRVKGSGSWATRRRCG